MKKILNITVIFFAAFMLLFLNSCSDDDDNNYEVSEEWKQHQASILDKVKVFKDEATGELIYTAVASEYGAGHYIYTKPSDYITNNQIGKFDKEGPSAFSVLNKAVVHRPLLPTDSVELRYEGWYYTLEDNKRMFDSTEIDKTTGQSENNAKTAIFIVNGGSGGPNIDGFKTALLDMKVGEERIVCIPYKLGYGSYGSYDSYGNMTIPGYTTLFFDIKLLRNFTEEKELGK